MTAIIIKLTAKMGEIIYVNGKNSKLSIISCDTSV